MQECAVREIRLGGLFEVSGWTFKKHVKFADGSSLAVAVDTPVERLIIVANTPGVRRTGTPGTFAFQPEVRCRFDPLTNELNERFA